MPTVVSLNSIMVDATGNVRRLLVPVDEHGKMVRKHCFGRAELDPHHRLDTFRPASIS